MSASFASRFCVGVVSLSLCCLPASADRDESDYIRRYERAAVNGSKAQKTAREALSRGYNLAKGDNVDAGIKEFTRAIAADPKCDAAYLERAFYLAYNEKYKEAIPDLTAAIKLDPTNNLAFRRRGIIHLGLNHLNEAIQDFNSALKLWPKDTNALQRRASAYQALGKK